MKDNHFTFLAFVVIALAIIWASMKKKPAVNVTPTDGAALPVAWSGPMDSVYAANPNAFAPPTASALTVNIGNQMASQLSDQYIPMFGFVGIAQGSMYQ